MGMPKYHNEELLRQVLLVLEKQPQPWVAIVGILGKANTHMRQERRHMKLTRR